MIVTPILFSCSRLLRFVASGSLLIYCKFNCTQDDVDEYMSQSENKSAEAVLRQLEEQHNKYKFMEYNLTTKKSR